jgi:hypothetical protein
LKNISRISVPYFEIAKKLVDYITAYKRESDIRDATDKNMIQKLQGELDKILHVPNNEIFQDQQRRFNQLMYELENSVKYRIYINP